MSHVELVIDKTNQLIMNPFSFGWF